ncbi:MAG TPA: rhodanese-like domain-containing protein [Vicinamibacteria bacterium]|nr:rhodanese-like domain-containing protein [Vicinamibacteria bacterium]
MRVVLSTMLGILMSCQPSTPNDMAAVKRWVRAEFPDVRQISVEELAKQLEAGGDNVVLLDARDEAEYAVSHLPGAIRIDPEEISAMLDGLDRDAAIVAYCSVGYRSSQLVERLAAQGFTDVANLEGSIFEWANRDLPLEREGLRVREVHPFDEKWGRLLREELRAYEPRTDLR